MDFRPWIAVVLASVINMIFYSQIFPVYTIVRSWIFKENILTLAAKWIPGNMIGTLDTMLNWVPLIILIGAIFYAIVATIIPQESDTWQGQSYQRRY